MAKYIFVTGGVVSSLGKGLTSAAIGLLLERRGLRVGLVRGRLGGLRRRQREPRPLRARGALAGPVQLGAARAGGARAGAVPGRGG